MNENTSAARSWRSGGQRSCGSGGCDSVIELPSRRFHFRCRAPLRNLAPLARAFRRCTPEGGDELAWGRRHTGAVARGLPGDVQVGEALGWLAGAWGAMAGVALVADEVDGGDEGAGGA